MGLLTVNITVQMPPLALIVGANRGIGLELVKQIKAKGFDVIGTTRNPSPELESVASEVINGIDVGVDGSPDGIAKALGDRKVDIVICNSGIFKYDNIDTIKIEDVQEQFNVNSLGPLRVFQAVRSNLKAGSKFAIVTSLMGSVEDNTSSSYYGYRTSKAAVNMIGKGLSIDCKKNGVVVALLHPGYVDTDMTKGAADKTGIISPQESVAGLVRVIERLSLDNTGQFWHHKGTILPW